MDGSFNKFVLGLFFFIFVINKFYMRFKYIIVVHLFLSIIFNTYGQSFYFGPKVGPALNFQQWNDIENDALLSLNGDVFIESAPEDGKSSLFASLGYRSRGSSWRTNSLGNGVNFNALNFRFNNAVLELGAKRKISDAEDNQPYYFIALRGEYNISTNLSQYEGQLYFPQEVFVRKWTYGPTFGGGYEFQFRDLIKFGIELSLARDLNQQYFQPALFNIPDPFFPGMLRNIQEREIVNTSFEIKFIMKFLRKVIYE